MTSDEPDARPSASEVATALGRRTVAALVADAGGTTGPRWRRHRHRAVGRRRRIGELSVAALLVALLVVVVGAVIVLSWPAALHGSPAPSRPASPTSALSDTGPP